MKDLTMEEKVDLIHELVDSANTNTVIIIDQNKGTYKLVSDSIDKMTKSVDNNTQALGNNADAFKLAALSLNAMSGSQQNGANISSDNNKNVLKFGFVVLGFVIVACLLISGVVVMKELSDMVDQVIKFKIGANDNVM